MITSERNKFLGVHVTAEVLRLLKFEARNAGISVSAYVFDVFIEHLTGLGHTIKDIVEAQPWRAKAVSADLSSLLAEARRKAQRAEELADRAREQVKKLTVP